MAPRGRKLIYECMRERRLCLIVRVPGKKQRTFFRDDYDSELEWRRAAEAHKENLMSGASLPPPVRLQRRSGEPEDNASNVVGVRRKPKYGMPAAWIAEWNPEPHVTVRRTFSVARWGEQRAKELAEEARIKRLTDDGRN